MTVRSAQLCMRLYATRLGLIRRETRDRAVCNFAARTVRHGRIEHAKSSDGDRRWFDGHLTLIDAQQLITLISKWSTE